MDSKPWTIIKVSQAQAKSNLQCSICLENYGVNEAVSHLICAHIFHEACISQWLLRQHTCPTCRTRLGNVADVEATVELYYEDESLWMEVTDDEEEEEEDYEDYMADEEDVDDISVHSCTHSVEEEEEGSVESDHLSVVSDGEFSYEEVTTGSDEGDQQDDHEDDHEEMDDEEGYDEVISDSPLYSNYESADDDS